MLNYRELGTVLAALRAWQAAGGWEAAPENLQRIATDGGLYRPLDRIDIDDLCERLNTSEDFVTLKEALGVYISELGSGDDAERARAYALLEHFPA